MIPQSIGRLCFFVLGMASSLCFSAEVQNLRCEYQKNPLGIDSAKPRFSWSIQSERRNQVQSGFQVLVASSLELLAKEQGDIWDSGKTKSNQNVWIEYAGKPLASGMAGFWKVRVWDGNDAVSMWSEPSHFSIGLLDASDWKGQWIGMASADIHEEPWFRKTFTLEQKPRSALIYVASIGYHELYVNGQKVDDRLLAPSVSYLTKRALYVTYDIAPLLKPGKNAVAVWLSPGWALFKGVNPVMDFQLSKSPVFIAQLNMRDAANKTTSVTSDTTWKCHLSSERHLGEWTNSNFGGDRIDTSKDLPGWNVADFDDSAWEVATAYLEYNNRKILSPDLVEPNRRMGEIHAVGIEKTGPSTYRIDLGENFSGGIEATLKGKPGNVVTLMASTEKGAECEFNQRDELVIGDSGQATFRNHFGYHEYRYVTISGVENAPALGDIHGYRIGNDLARTGHFDASNPLLKRIYDATYNNCINLTTGGMMVDCPHRERLGYGGDAHTSMEMNLSSRECGAFYSKWAQDWCDIQPEDGDIAHTAPTIDGGGGPGWGGFVILMPWQVYQTYGDRRILEKTYPHMKRWLAFVQTKCDAEELFHPFGGSWGFLGDWVTPHGSEQSDSPEAFLFNNCYRLYAIRIVAKVARALGQTEDAQRYEAQAGIVKKAVHKRFFNATDNTYLDTKQTHCVMPLVADLVPEELVPKVMENLRNEILVAQKGHLDVGLHGLYFMTKYLTEHDGGDLVFTYANQPTYPGYGNFLELGVNTWPEEWGKLDSKIHGCYNSIGGWFLHGLGGVRPDPNAPGFQHFIVKPTIVGDLTWVKSDWRSLQGPIVSHWTRNGQSLTMEITIPANTSATVYVPSRNGTAVTESGKPIEKAEGVRVLSHGPNETVLEIGSGHYQFRSEIDR
jgi:hypothetical protein